MRLQNVFDKSKTRLINRDETVESIDFELMRGGVITGRVTDADGRPIIEETVSISSAEPNRIIGYSISSHRGTRTDDRGVYRLFGIAPGTYKVAAGRNEVSPSWERSPFRQTFAGRQPVAFLRRTVSPEGTIQLGNLAPGRYWILVQPAAGDELSTFPRFRSPDETETRARLRRDAEELKTEIELRPCQDLRDFKITGKSPVDPVKLP